MQTLEARLVATSRQNRGVCSIATCKYVFFLSLFGEINRRKDIQQSGVELRQQRLPALAQNELQAQPGLPRRRFQQLDSVSSRLAILHIVKRRPIGLYAHTDGAVQTGDPGAQLGRENFGGGWWGVGSICAQRLTKRQPQEKAEPQQQRHEQAHPLGRMRRMCGVSHHVRPNCLIIKRRKPARNKMCKQPSMAQAHCHSRQTSESGVIRVISQFFTARAAARCSGARMEERIRRV
ncbi:hypothetical protein MAIT1_03624 [Magnetofaba australis IT-1]|uniref:Uncharacterized protein n=1 Tax=Magnetofaba australis IT-1 TaxID=1434232 RepID=A0A1Y2K449_9PROT|nr:hypothetical protein MAIT1_03624 [Magnetofaba australis IT-1]